MRKVMDRGGGVGKGKREMGNEKVIGVASEAKGRKVSGSGKRKLTKVE